MTVTKERAPRASPAGPRAGRRAGGGGRWARSQGTRTAWVFIGPAVLLLGVFAVAPIVVALATSTTDLDLRGLADWADVQFIGLANYVELFSDPVFYTALGNTAIYVVLGVPLTTVLAFAIATALNQGTSRLFSGYRALFFMPAITNIVAVSVIWTYLYNTDSGLINWVISAAGIGPVPWLDQPFTAKIALIIVGVWKAAGFNMLIFLAAMQGIPKEFDEAAAIDGASWWRRQRFVTIPLLRHATFFVVVTSTISWLQFFEEPFVMTDGGPLDGTVSVALFIYKSGFNLSQFGYAAAASFVLFVVIMIITAIQFKLRRSDVEY